jgi:formylglycine-generating enzyme required for sulfatase activity
VIAGLVAILATVRRWSWSEADRETFLVERGVRPGAMRVGFKEDLRDEALVAIVFLFFLIPVGLRQIQLATCDSGTCAFTLEGGATLPPDAIGQFIAWLGYFGAELAKSVPFVDWSEVFHVANDSPIEPQTPLGAQIVFAMRATLDLLLLAAVLQAVQIAGRLRDQWNAFNADRLPILEPHTEKRLFKSTCEAIEPCLEQHPTQQHAIASFPAYEDTRLQEVIRDRTGKMPTEARKAAVALLAGKHASEATDQFFAEQEAEESIQEVRDWIVHVATGVTRDRDGADHDADRARLKALLEDRFEATAVRAAAARRLARMPDDAVTTALLQERLVAPKESLEVRAAAALALARHRPKDARTDIEKLAGAFSGKLSVDGITPAMATAHALARRATVKDANAIASAFAEPIRELAAAAARMQAEPMTIDAAKASEPGAALNQMVRIAPGEDPFRPEFTLGSGDDDDLAFTAETPPKKITMSRPYAIGRYAVTQEEYLIFSEATGLKPLQYALKRRWPAVEVNWRDAMACCRWLEAVTGDAYRLPSEVEWEYACRAGTKTRWSWDDEWDQAKAASVETRSGQGPVDVESYDPNDWGLWQMHGNVLEWCGDPWHENHSGRPEGQGIWDVGGTYSRRVVRGGSWNVSSQVLRSAYRIWLATDLRNLTLGFRLARTLNP